MVLALDKVCWGINSAKGCAREEYILKDISLTVGAGEVSCLVGASGAGKTSLLRLIAGLESPCSGTISITPHTSTLEGAILVFQEYLLFPHCTVFDNVAFGLRARGYTQESLCSRVHDILHAFHLIAFSERYPSQLSAGQAQRVALARAFVCEPAVLLLDEPFANLDNTLRSEMSAFVREHAQKKGTAVLSATHNLEEAFSMANRLGVLLDGQLKIYDEPYAVYRSTQHEDVSAFLGACNKVDASLCHILGWSESLLQSLQCAAAPSPATSNNPIYYVRPGLLSLIQDPEGCACVQSSRFTGHIFEITLRVENHLLVAYSLDCLEQHIRVQIALRETGILF